MRLRPQLLLILATALAPACAGGSPRQAAGESGGATEVAGITAETRPTRVTFQDHRSGVVLGVLNESLARPAEYYSQPRQQLVYKVIPDLDMGALLASLDELGYFEAARPGLVRIPGARVSVVVERGGQGFTLAYTPEDEPERVELVQKCAMAVQAMYNHHQGWQILDNPEGAAYFEREKARLPGGGKPK